MTKLSSARRAQLAAAYGWILHQVIRFAPALALIAIAIALYCALDPALPPHARAIVPDRP